MTVPLKDSDLLRDQSYVDGHWTGADSGATFEVRDPATGEPLRAVPRLGRAETARAIDAANRALPAWRATTAAARGQVMRRWAELIRQHADDVAAIIMTAEQGKPLAEARGEVVYAASFLDWFAEEGRRAYGDIIPSDSPDTRILVLKQPVGVTAGITPWNLPCVMVTRKAAPALAAGCTMVLKPAEQTPLTALALAELADRAGVPAGVFNVVTGDAQDAPVIGAELLGNPIVRKVSFTGSTEVGKLILRQAADQVKKVSLELGGNSPFIVFDDADLEAAAEGIMSAKYRNSGQLCTAANRVFVQEGVADAFVETLRKRVAALRVGNGFDAGTDMGPLIDTAGLEKVQRHVADLVAKGGTVVHGGAPHELGGTFYQPTIVTGLSKASETWREELFGPVSAITTFADEAEVIEMANDTSYGLVSYVYSKGLGRVRRLAEALESGMVAVNTGRVSGAMAPFGGIKESRLGREGSKYGPDDWLETKYVNLGGLDA